MQEVAELQEEDIVGHITTPATAKQLTAAAGVSGDLSRILSEWLC